MSIFNYNSVQGVGRGSLILGGLFIYAAFFSPTALAQTYQPAGYISAQDIYENPDDLDLNLDYAKQEIRRGEMLNAASALERMLYANPNWHSSRLLYAAVLYRLDDNKAALRELSLLKGRDLNEKQMLTYERYSAEFQTPLPSRASSNSGAPTSATSANGYASSDPLIGELSLGLRADNNAGNALTDEGFGFGDREDVSLHAQGRLRFSAPITADNSVTARAAIGGQIRRHEEYSQADYDVIDLQAGISLKPSEQGRLSLDIDARRVNVSGEKYLDQIGPRVTLSEVISDKTRASFSVSAYDQNYYALETASRENDRDGLKLLAQLGIQTQLNDRQKLSLAVGYDKKNAEIDAFAYTGPRALLGFEHTLKSGAILKTQAFLRQLNYKASLDLAVDEREDTRFSIRQSLGTSLDALIGNPELEKIGIEFGVNYNDRQSNIRTNNYDNLGVDAKLKFNF